MYVAGVPVTPAVTSPLTHSKKESYGGRVTELYRHSWVSNNCAGGPMFVVYIYIYTYTHIHIYI